MDGPLIHADLAHEGLRLPQLFSVVVEEQRSRRGLPCRNGAATIDTLSGGLLRYLLKALNEPPMAVNDPLFKISVAICDLPVVSVDICRHKKQKSNDGGR